MGRDVLGRAPTGSGKTLAFGIPVLQLVERAEPRRPRGLILAPTRELAEQIRRDLLPIANAVDRKLVAIYGGVAMNPQVKSLRSGVDVVIATPGRLMDLIEQGEVSLDQVDRVVVDEADRMADMGFLPDVRELLDLTNPVRQTFLFSATLDNAVAILTEHYQVDPVSHRVEGAEDDLSETNHRFIRLKQPDKIPIAADIIDSHGSTMVFCRTRHGVDRVCRQLKAVGIKAAWIHGGRSQAQRDAALMAFTDGRARALVATDVAARGIHVDNVACVLHFDPPADAKDYVHRSGRTARAGQSGQVVSFVTNDHFKRMVRMQDEMGIEADFETSGEVRQRHGATPVTDAELGLQSHGQEQSRKTREWRGGKANRPAVSKAEPKEPAKSKSKDRSAPTSDERTAGKAKAGKGRKPQRSRSGKPRPKNKGRAKRRGPGRRP
ncbi:MAG: DEAD/DEAH box helicase [Acidimicrobiales bacterium]|nr:DEAD/DEAH box helicase [Acidimicrobiales bacterium]